MFFRVFRWSLIITVLSLIAAYFYGGWTALFLCFMLAILEVSLSFDNAVLNATILKRMSEFWQKIFLTVGIFIAVFGMRLLFPLLIVGIVAQLSPVEAIQLALQKGSIEDPGTYAYILNEAKPQIAAFGGMFLLMLFLTFVFEDRKLKWLRWIEVPLAKIGKLEQMAMVVSLITLVLVAQFLAEKPMVVLLSGILGVVTYVVINGLGKLFESGMEHKLEDDDKAAKKSGRASGLALATGKAGFFLFLYLEVLDASFSFDGVIGAFAITSDPIIIALGLGLIGAMFVRSITVYLVRQGSLGKFAYLEHGAHWAIGALAAILLLSIGYHVNEIITGLIGVVFIAAAFISSLIRNKHKAAKA
ncbi:MAG: hypothetical protein JWO54_650 [Candidatus Saccharibacteria bacterium]|nr:hypothetical protein [Candidatus Saccharibacteria bacterium]MDB5180890.1 hypothetical protein [Candidatus Saccharibacteria bacterium]